MKNEQIRCGKCNNPFQYHHFQHEVSGKLYHTNCKPKEELKENCLEISKQAMQECKCACHENKLNTSYEHSSMCCSKMNGYVDNKICLICNKLFYKPVYLSWKVWEKRKFCSEKCLGRSMKGKPSWNKGKVMSVNARKNMSKAHPRENHPLWKNGLSRTKEGKNHYTKADAS